MVSIKRPPVLIITLVQIAVTAVLSVLLMLRDPILATSYLCGGIIAILPTAYFAFYAFRYMGARSAKDITRSIYKGEVGKYILTLVGFALVFMWFKQINVLILFVAYVSMLALHSYMAAKLIKRYS